MENLPEFEGYVGKWAARYLCYLPGYQINKKKTENLTDGHFILTNSNGIELAKVSMADDVITNIKALESDNQALIEWNLLVINAENSSNINTNVI